MRRAFCLQSDRQKTDLAALRNYEETRDEWMHVEAVIKQRLMSKPKLSSRASADNISTELPMAENFSKHSLLDRQLSNLSNEVSTIYVKSFLCNIVHFCSLGPDLDIEMV